MVHAVDTILKSGLYEHSFLFSFKMKSIIAQKIVAKENPKATKDEELAVKKELVYIYCAITVALLKINAKNANIIHFLFINTLLVLSIFR